MRMLWTVEKDGALILRGSKHEPLVHIGRCDPRTSTFTRPGFVATVLEPGMPSCGPYKSRQACAEWAERIIAKLHHGATFSDIPQFRDFPSDSK